MQKRFFYIRQNIIKIIQGKFLCYLKEAYKKGELIFEGKIRRFKNTDEFRLITSKGYALEWVVYSKKPFAGSEQVIRYLGKYTHRVAIGNSRIVSVSDGNVQFKWKDYKDGGQEKIMTVTAQEFIRRFLLHVFPKRFVRIRFYGFLSNVKKNENLKITRELFNNQINCELDNNSKKEEAHELFLRMTGIDITRCPYCKNGTLSIVSDDLKLYLDSS